MQYLQKLDETGECFLSSLWIGLSERMKLSNERVYDILSLQENGLFLGQDGVWRIQQKKKWRGKINVEKIQSRFAKDLEAL